MQTRFITSGIVDEQPVILAYELHEAAFKLDLQVVPKKLLTRDTLDQLSNGWASGDAFTFPEGTELISPDLNSDSILPSHIKSDKTGEIRHKQNEWAIQLLTNKLWEGYLLELEDLKKKASALTGYSKALFDDAKTYWERVLEHKKERNISQERLEKIKEDVNQIFEQLKNFRKSEITEFEKNSSTVKDHVTKRLTAIKDKAHERANFKALHDEIRGLQNEIRNQYFSKADENIVRKAFDDAIHYINEQRNKNFHDHFDSRIAGLRDVMGKMEKGLERDKKDLDYLNSKAENPRIQSLELQLLKLKVRQLKDTIQSKEEKLKDIQKTLESIIKQSNRGAAKQEETKVESKTDKPNVKKPKKSEQLPQVESPVISPEAASEVSSAPEGKTLVEADKDEAPELG